LRDVDTGDDLPDELPRGRYFGVSITPDKSGLYYTRHNETGPRVYYHAMGTDPSADRQVFGDGYGPEKILFGGLSEDGRYLVVHVLYGSSADKTEIYIKDLEQGGGFATVVDDLDARSLAGMAGDTLLIQTNWEAPNGRIMAVDASNPGRDSWRELVPEREKGVIQGTSEVGGKLFVRYLEDVKSRVVSYDVDGRELGEIKFDTIGDVSGVSGRWADNRAFFRFHSYHVPLTIYSYDVETGEREVWWQFDADIDTDRFDVKQEWFTSKDGTRVPMFVVHAKDIRLDGTNPMLLTGYGGFTVSRTPRFSASAAVWVEQGGVYAVANLRGGGEFGEEWHKAGMRENKQNVFDDFIAAAEHLVDAGYTSSGKLAISGGSNGGLLVGAVMTQRPELFKAVICSYPLLDMVRYHMFLVARYWVPEYGSADEPEQFEYLKAYSPYHNVKDGESYPAILFISGDGDTRVAPLHARKMAALVQAKKGSERPALLRYHIKAGHSGGKPLSQQIDDLAESYSFLLWQLEAHSG
jgi:prolyl oligopeptidase